MGKNLRVNLATLLFLFVCLAAGFAEADELRVVQIYKQDDLLSLIKENKHLDRVVEDKCQLNQDIEARARVMKIPAYQFLWGDMLAWGVCVNKKQVALGIDYIQRAADQGLPEALEQLGRYYHKGKLVQQDMHRAIIYLRESGSLGNLSAQIRLAEIFLDGHGSPYDYEDVYHWLHNSVTADENTHQKISNALAGLRELMHPKAVRRAKRPLEV